MHVLRVDPTPSPNAIKFVLDGNLGITREFKSLQDAESDELARSLFAVPGIESLFFNENYITVTMRAEADWHTVHQEAQKAIAAWQSGDEVTGAGKIPILTQEAMESAGEQAELLERIASLLQDRVVPALSMDGGGLQVLGITDSKTLRIMYQGACGSCPSAIQGTLMAIENLIRSEIDPDVTVIPAGMPM